MARSGLILRQPPLIYRAGRPGFDPSHPASNGIRFSGISVGKNFNNLLSVPPTGTASGTSSVVDGLIGLATKFSGSNHFVKFTGQSTANDQAATVGCIFRFNTLSGTPVLFANAATTATGYALQINSSGAAFFYNNASGTTGASSFDLAAGNAYFIGASFNSSVANFVLANLQNGQVFSSSSTGMSTANTAPDGNYLIGSDQFSNSSASSIAAIMVNSNLMSIPQLMQWAQDPWSFWYPNHFDLENVMAATAAVITDVLMAQAWM